MGPFLYSMATKARCHFILEMQKCQPTVDASDCWHFATFLHGKASLFAFAYSNFQHFLMLKRLLWRMWGPFPHRNLNLLQRLQLILQDLWESRCLARKGIAPNSPGAKNMACLDPMMRVLALSICRKIEHFQAFPRLKDCSPCICINYRLNNVIKRLREYHAWEFANPFDY